MRVKVKIKKAEGVEVPQYMSEGASGFDLKAHLENPVTLNPGEWALIPTGIHLEIPSGFEVQVRPRSGLASKGITVLNTPGTIDSDYRGEIKIILVNLSKEPFTIGNGMRIAQGVLCRVYKADFVEADLSPTNRGKGGFGSTGVE
ncbi:dUTP pyrophosphatase [Thermosulfidibacter takaii ABI70S6]|uniref:Deoxyuridine 5'-triphosphate nucleotidohydrolase n=1 Tax=Thermosulfidibacter takaii (strain DSM 17441 / JCM 13301 / NBRC 103674 / ABI70S6) TaxID=1298851 RepID=A0A0S3QS61_THET7|nr:dUTP diphosphatase [Thermosulfidibacter takaii]BAT71121.1 dUTP pyrophosphatase [Thermosulfidibacter takaii ABI70S6]